MEKLKHIIHPGRPKAVKKDTSFRHWIIAFVVCNFNVDIGPEVELVYPPDVEFSHSDLMAICFNSFPERHDSEITEDAFFKFTVRNNSPDISLGSPYAPHGSPTEFFGHCVFRQEYDRMTKRSFNQKALTLISNQPFSAFFLKLLQKMTVTGNILDPSMLEAVHDQIAAWQPPSGGRHELPFMGSLMVLEIPPHPAFPLQGLEGPPSDGELSRMSLYAYQPIGSWNRLLCLLPSIVDLYVIYEKLLLCESVIVIAKNPQICSECVSACVDLVRPVPYAGLVRPYLIMQSDFSSLGLDQTVASHFCIGITNPFLLQRITSAAETSKRPAPHVLYLHENDDRIPIKKSSSQRQKRQTAMDFPGAMTIDKENSSKKYLKSDHGLTKTLDQILTDRYQQIGSEDANTLVRRHFAELTAQFLAPLNRYLATNMATNPFSPGGKNLSYANFSTADFLQSLAKHGTSVKFRGQNPLQRHKARDGMYEAFCNSPNFYSWLDMKLSLEKEASVGLLNQG
ncbi:DUF1630-domain-containing protein [Rhizodiscina lignyota]|uniref:DUF1630-domain-containing protein n=1 Tax=Rhizodiscina lignyota TaxID=1504668 RepID=A0A9P4MC54_9PEZI|nr:DUF1630-domain-containing protein [Rhizodiscina lignyota]